MRTLILSIVPAKKADAIAACERAAAEAGDVEEAGDLIRRWAKDRKAGSYHPAITGAPPLTFGGRTGFKLGFLEGV